MVTTASYVRGIVGLIKTRQHLNMVNVPARIV